jgi:hypothetical protein
LLPYLNTALSELQEIFELNNIPSTNETSATIAVPSATICYRIYYCSCTTSDLVEIQQLWESQTGQDNWMPVTKKEFLTASILGTVQLTVFGIWAWIDQEIRVRAAVTPIDLEA